MDENGASDIIHSVVTHEDILQQLIASPMTKPELLAELDVSRSTIDRWLNDLMNKGLVHRPNTKCELTLFGRLISRRYDEFNAWTARLKEARAALSVLTDQDGIEPELFDNASIETYTGLAPEITNALLQKDGTIHILSPLAPIVGGMMMDHDLSPVKDLEILAARPIINQISQTLDHQSFLRNANVTLRVITSPPPYCLGLVKAKDHVTGYIIIGGQGNNITCIENTATEFVDWIQNQYDSCREHAVAVEETTITGKTN